MRSCPFPFRSALVLAIVFASHVAAQRPTVNLAGRIVDTTGRPLADATFGFLGGDLARTGADGRFSFALLPDAAAMRGDQELYASAARHVSYRLPTGPIELGLSHRGQHGDAVLDLGDLRLPDGVALRGRVRGPGGAPLGGAVVRAFDELTSNAEWQAGWGGATVSEPNGRFTLAGVFAHGMRLEITADGYYREVLRGVGIGTPLDVDLQPSGFVTGPLPREGDAVFAGAVEIHSEFPGESFRAVPTEGDTFRLAVPTRGRFRVLAHRADGSIAWQSPVLAGPRDGVELLRVDEAGLGAPAPAGRIEGRLVDAAGKPVADCPIECRPQDERSNAPRFQMRTTADGGFAAVGLARERYVVTAAVSPLAPRSQTSVDLAQREVVADLKLELTAGVAVTGRITGLAPGRDWHVMLVDIAGSERERQWLDTVLDPNPWHLTDAVLAPVAADGTFRFADCGPRNCRLELCVPAPPRGGAPVHVALRDVVVAGSAIDLVVDATAALPATVAGSLRVTGAEVPAGRFAVVASRDRPRAVVADELTADRSWQLVGDGGRFELLLAPGRHLVQVVDTVTGVTMTDDRSERMIDLKAGSSIAVDLAVAAVAVTVAFGTATEGAAFVDHVQIDIGRTAAGPEVVTQALFGGGTYGASGVYIEGRPGPARFFVPPGPFLLSVDGATKLDAGEIHFGAARGRMDAATGDAPELRVEFPLAPPADLGGE